MLDTILIGETGLLGYTRGLSNIGNNIANLNTTGYKSTSLNFAELFFRFQPTGDDNDSSTALQFGSGLAVTGSSINFKQGETRQTGNDLDAAVNGNGFFVLRKDGETVYTRNGQFTIDRDGYLTAQSSGERVAALAAGNRLTDINVNTSKTSPPKATQTVKFAGNLSVNDADGIQTISNLNVIDGSGASNTLTVTFTNNSAVTPRSWLIQVDDAGGSTIANGELRFQGDGSPDPAFNTFNFTYTPASAAAQSITFDFGTPGTFSGATSFSAGTDSTLAVSSQDGLAPGSLTKVTLDADGNVVLTYSNGQTTKLARLALATFPFLQGLRETSGSDFENKTGQTAILGYPNTGAFGLLVPGSIEASNVDLSQQFSELIIMQRGFQSSSQVISAANEMIQQLLDLRTQK